MMFEVLLEMIVYFFVEIIFQGIILGIFRGAKLVGLLTLKLITLNNKSINDLKEKYKDSSKPYFIGFGLIIGIIYLITKVVN